MTFAQDIRAWARKTKRGYKEVTNKALFNVSNSIRIKTPVDTGETVNNWQATANTPAAGVIEGAGSPGEQVAHIKEGVAVAFGGVYYYVNNLEWIRELEYEGHSDKAPEGMVRISVEEFRKHLQDAIATETNN